MEPLVSVVVPCYNVAPYIQKFFDSLLEQSHRKLQVIIVDDGSTDGTSTIIDKNITPLKSKGFSVIAFRQSNRGLAGAVNSGLSHVNGEFLTWPDPDDWLMPDSFKGRVDIMLQYPDAAVLRSNAEVFDDAKNEKQGAFTEIGESAQPAEGLFEKLLFLSTFFAPVCHMVRTKPFFEIYPSKTIYVTSSASQNLQMLLPLVERYPVYETGRSFAVWRKRSDSRSQRARQPAELLDRLEMLHDVSRNVIALLQQNPDLAREWSDQNFYRNKLLPVAFEGRLKHRVLEYLELAALPWPRRVVARILTELHCQPRKPELFPSMAKQNSFQTRAFRRLVRFQWAKKTYPHGPSEQRQ